MDDRAVAALVVAKRSSSPTKRGWAADTLESMGRERADEQIRTSSDDVLAGIFRAYGEARDPDALGVLSSFVGSGREALRTAARDALLAYGKEATSRLRQDYTELAGKAPPSTWTAEATAQALFAEADRVRLRDVHALLDRGLASAHDGNLGAAVEDLDAVLARHEGGDRSGDIARVYAAYGIALEDSDPARARAYFERAERVDPRSSAGIDGELAVLDGRELEARGVPGEATYRRALALDPANERARAALDRLEERSRSRRATLRRWTLAAVATVLVLSAVILFVGRGARRAGRRAQAGM
jgi:tetratricopeptide (TPR) repeat protein